MGNVRAFLNLYKRLNIDATIASNADRLKEASKVILPGVGDFDHAMQCLEQSGMRETLDELALQKQVPLLGICVGMQILARSSDEGAMSGLGWISGDVRSFRSHPAAHALALPHMGWNDVHPTPGNRLFNHLESDARFYFLHSYYFRCDQSADSAAVTRYGWDFSSSVRSGNIYGVQFHPEKSHRWGTRLLQNFAAL